MNVGDDFLFNLHQFILLLMCLFFMYFAWRDQAADTFDKLKFVSPKAVVPLLIGIFIGTFIYLLREWGPVGGVLAFAFAFLVSFSIFDPKYAVSFFIFILISRPWEFINDQVLAGMPRDIFLLCFLSFVAHKIVRKRFDFQWNKATACVIFFSIWTFFSIVPSGHSFYGFVKYEEVFTKGVIVYLLIVNVVNKKEYIMPVQIALVLGITEKAIISFYNATFLGIVADGERLTSVGILENSNDIAAIMILAIPFTLAFLKGTTLKPLKYLLAFIVLAFYTYLIWQSKSRGAILGIGSLIVTWMWLKSNNKKLATFILVFGAVASIGLISMIQRSAEDVEGSTSNRKIYWGAALKMGVKKPLLGVGYYGYPLNLLTYTDGHVGTEGRYKTAHSTWLLALAETGIPGFIFYMGIWIFSLRSAWAMRVEHPEFLLAIVSYGVTISFLSHTYMLYPYILLGLTVASGQFFLKTKEKIQINGLERPYM